MERERRPLLASVDPPAVLHSDVHARPGPVEHGRADDAQPWRARLPAAASPWRGHDVRTVRHVAQQRGLPLPTSGNLWDGSPLRPPCPTPTTVGARLMEVPRLTKRPRLQCPPWSQPQPTRASATSPSCSRCWTTRTTLLETLRPTTSPRKWSPAVTLHIRLLNLTETYHQWNS